MVLEKMPEPAKKLRITGKGRCNVTNACDRDTLFRNLPRGQKFLMSALSRFSPQDTMDFFEAHGVPLKIERGNRVFPVSDKAEDIRRALLRYAESSGATILHEEVKSLLFSGDSVCGVKTANHNYTANAVLLATGGASYPRTGSTGDGYRMATEAGHTVTPILPSLVPIVIKEPFCKDLMGLSLRNVTLTVRNANGKTVFQELGELLFTHFGVSGPLVLSASAYLRTGKVSDYRFFIDCKPGLTDEQLDKRLLRDFAETPNRTMVHLMPGLLPQKLGTLLLRLADIPYDCKANELTREQRKKLASLCKALPLTPVDFRPISEAIVTAGGVSLDEVNPKTMESKIKTGLYFAGELLDADGLTGGFNLQIAFATANAAAEGILAHH